MAEKAAAAAAGQRRQECRAHAEEALRELLALARSGDEATRARATGAVLGLTGDPEGRRLVAGEAAALLALSEEEPCPAVARDTLRALVNLAAAAAGEEEEDGEPGVGALVAAALRGRDGALPGLLRRAIDGGETAAAALLANASRGEAACRGLWDAAAGGDEGAALLARLLDALGRRREPHLAALLCNLSRLPDVRRRLLEPRRQVRHPEVAAPRAVRRPGPPPPKRDRDAPKLLLRLRASQVAAERRGGPPSLPPAPAGRS